MSQTPDNGPPEPDPDREPGGRPGREPSAAGPGGTGGARRGPEPPKGPTDLKARSWKDVLRRTVKEFGNDQLTDRAAALTYYGVLSLFPALLVLVSCLGIVGKQQTNFIIDNVAKFAPGAVRDILTNAVKHVQQSGSGTGIALAIIGLLGALWSASGYISAFIRVSNAVYDVPEGRPAWKVTPLRVGLTLLMVVLIAISTVIVVFSGTLAQKAGQAMGLDSTALTVWEYAKWPVLLVLVVLMIAVLYWAAPNVRGRGLRWVTPGSALAVVVWLAASALFAVYVANFGSYNKTYGSVASIIIFLVWLWLTNTAILLGLELDAELTRERAITAGHPAGEEPYVEPRDTRKWPDEGPGGGVGGAGGGTGGIGGTGGGPGQGPDRPGPGGAGGGGEGGGR